MDLAQGHFTAKTVAVMVVAVLSAGAGVMKTYYDMTWQMKLNAMSMSEFPTKKDLEKAKTDISVEMTHSAGERVKFYLQHAMLDCPRAGTSRTCRLIWPLPEPPKQHGDD